jgi:hypothetical protein
MLFAARWLALDLPDLDLHYRARWFLAYRLPRLSANALSVGGAVRRIGQDRSMGRTAIEGVGRY